MKTTLILDPKNIERINNIFKTAELTVQEYMKLYNKTTIYDTFIVNYLKLNKCISSFELECTLDWLEDNRNNDLKLQSSGSLFTALIDFDNLITTWGEDVLNEDENEYAWNLYQTTFQIYIDWSYKN